MCCKSISAHNRPPSSQATFTKTVQLAPHYVVLYLLPLLRPRAGRHVFMSYRGLSTDALFVCRLKHLAAARSTCLKHAGKEVAISIFVEDQFVLVWSVVGLGFPYLEESGCRSVHAADFHNTEIRIVERVHAVVACGKFGVPRMELERNCNFEIIGHLRLRLARMYGKGENQGRKPRAKTKGENQGLKPRAKTKGENQGRKPRAVNNESKYCGLPTLRPA